MLRVPELYFIYVRSYMHVFFKYITKIPALGVWAPKKLCNMPTYVTHSNGIWIVLFAPDVRSVGTRALELVKNAKF